MVAHRPIADIDSSCLRALLEDCAFADLRQQVDFGLNDKKASKLSDQVYFGRRRSSEGHACAVSP